MGERFCTSRRVEFRDTDAAGIVHFSVFFAYMEQTEHELLRHVGLSVVSHDDGRTISWPRVAANCNYRKSIRFEEVVEIEAWVARMGNKSITYGFEFRLDGETIADGTVTTVCCEISEGQPPVPIGIRPEFIEKLGRFAQR